MLRLTLILVAIWAPAIADVKTKGRTIECYCTDKTGSRIELGELICLQVDGRMFTARCEMSLNNPMWREIQEGCNTSDLNMSPIPEGLFDKG